jgi:cytochrome c oxidase assembly protein subunit 15
MRFQPQIQQKKYGRFALFGIVLLTGQIALGGWTSSNYAALSCVELPICQSGWQEKMNFEKSFALIPPARESYEFGHLSHDERVTIHVVHRFGAIAITIYLTWLLMMIYLKAQTSIFRRSAVVVGLALLTQLSLGVSNIWFSLPLSVAVGHNLVAACLMLTLIALTYRLRRKI